MNIIKQITIFGAVAILMAGCSTQNPTSPSISDSTEKTFATGSVPFIEPGGTIESNTSTVSIQASNNSVSYAGKSCRVYVRYTKANPLTKSSKIISIKLQKNFGPYNSRNVTAQTKSTYSWRPPKPPVKLVSAYNPKVGKIYLGFDKKGHLVYVKQKPKVARGKTLFCYWIRSYTANSTRITKYRK